MLVAFQFAVMASALGLLVAVAQPRPWQSAFAVPRQVRLLARNATVLAALLDLPLLVERGCVLLERSVFEVSPRVAIVAALDSWGGRLLALQFALLALAAMVVWFAPALRLARHLSIPMLIGGMACTAAAGHAVASGQGGALSLLGLMHVVLAGLWFAGLAPLWLAFRAASVDGQVESARALLARFSRFALPGMVLLVASGVYLAVWAVGSWPALFATQYGAVMLAKLAALALALWQARGLRRLLALPAGRKSGLYRRLLGREWICAGIVLLTAGVLGTLVPAAHDTILWPYAYRVAPETAWKLRGAIMLWRISAGAVMLAASVIVARRWSRLRPRTAFGLGMTGTLGGLAMVVAPLTVDAYPTTYRIPSVSFDVAAVADGAALYQKLCAACHGAAGHGDGPLAAGLAPQPADLTAPHLGWHTHGDMYWWITHGFAGSAMPAFEQQTSVTQRWNLINYLMALSLGYEARNLGTRPAPRDPWLAAIDVAFIDADGEPRTLSASQGREPALLVIDFSDAAADQGPLLAWAKLLSESRGEVLHVVGAQDRTPCPGFALPAAADEVDRVAVRACEGIVDTDASIRKAWQLYRRTLAHPDPRDREPPPARLVFLIDRFGFVRARWRSDESASAPEPGTLRAALAELAAEPELRTLDQHGH